MDAARKKVKGLDNNMTKYFEVTKEGLLKRHKGLSHRYIVKHDDYLSRICEFYEFDKSMQKDTDGIAKVDTFSLQSEKGKMFLMKSSKVKSSRLMYKTYIFEDGVTTCPIGHHH